MYNHHIIDIKFDTENPLLDMELFKDDLQQLIEQAGVTVMNEYYHRFVDPYHGFTGVTCLAESHISVHTWPEHNNMAIDVFICEKDKEKVFMDLFFKKFSPNGRRDITHFQHKSISRLVH